MKCLVQHSLAEPAPEMTSRTRSFKNQVIAAKQRRGAAVVLIVVSFVVFLLMAALSIDVAYMQLARLELRAATDAAAKAGAEALVRQDSADAAIESAIRVAAFNPVGNQPLELKGNSVQLGRNERQSDGTFAFTRNAKPFDAVRIVAKQPVSLFFGGVTGMDTFETRMTSTASFAESEICIVVDRSHSMCFDLTGVEWSYPPSIPTGPDDPVIHPPHPTDSRWAFLQSAIDEFVRVVEERNAVQRVSLVTFGSNITSEMYESQLTGRTFPAVTVDVPMGTDFHAVASAINARGNDVMLGATNLSAGMTAAIDVLTGANTLRHSHKTMVVMTDGQWNFGTDPVGVAGTAKSQDITVNTVTFMERADQTAMIDAATVGGGRHYHAVDGEGLVDAFRELAFNLPVSLTE